MLALWGEEKVPSFSESFVLVKVQHATPKHTRPYLFGSGVPRFWLFDLYMPSYQTTLSQL